MEITYPEIGVCGLSCRLCPRYHTDGPSRCHGCKTESRMAAGCPFITCAIKKRGIEFCWDCEEKNNCQKWSKHRELGKQFDSFVCYQKLEDNIRLAGETDAANLDKLQAEKNGLLERMLDEYNEGRSKSYFCIAATVMTSDDLRLALTNAADYYRGSDIKEKSKAMHKALDEIAAAKDLQLRLRKPSG